MDRLISEQELLKHFDPREDWVVVQTIKAIPSAETINEIIQKAYEDGKKDGYVQAKKEQEPKTGHWIQVDSDKCKCDQCEITQFIAMYPNGNKNYCSNCGAKMSEIPTSSKPEISSFYGLRSYVRERSEE